MSINLNIHRLIVEDDCFDEIKGHHWRYPWNPQARTDGAYT